jgi:hypothetical protein
LAAYTVRLLSFREAHDWEQIIASETNTDLSSVILEGKKISSDKAKRSAEIVASTILHYLTNFYYPDMCSKAISIPIYSIVAIVVLQ